MRDLVLPLLRSSSRGRALRPSRAGLAFVLALLLLTGARVARAGDSALDVRFSPQSACADDVALADKLRERGVRRVRPGEAATHTALLEVSASGAGYEARMTLREGNEPPLSRVVTAPSCDEVLTVFALTLALALEEPPAPPAPPAAAPPAAAPPKPAAPRSAASTARPFYGAAATGAVVIGASPVPTPAVGGFAELGAETPDRVFAPRARLGAYAEVPATVTVSQIDVRFALQAARLDLCPAFVVGAFSVVPCARLDVGRFQAASLGVVGARLVSAAWVTAQAALVLEWSPLPWLFANAGGSVGAALTRPTLSVGSEQLFSASAVVGDAEFGAGVRFR